VLLMFPLPTVTMCRDLGITVKNDLDFSDHIVTVKIAPPRPLSIFLHLKFFTGTSLGA